MQVGQCLWWLPTQTSAAAQFAVELFCELCTYLRSSCTCFLSPVLISSQPRLHWLCAAHWIQHLTGKTPAHYPVQRQKSDSQQSGEFPVHPLPPGVCSCSCLLCVDQRYLAGQPRTATWSIIHCYHNTQYSMGCVLGEHCSTGCVLGEHCSTGCVLGEHCSTGCVLGEHCSMGCVLGEHYSMGCVLGEHYVHGYV